MCIFLFMLRFLGIFSPHSSTHKWMDSTFMFPVEVILDSQEVEGFDGQNSATWPGILDLTKAPGTSVLPLPVKAIPEASWQPPPATCIIPIYSHQLLAIFSISLSSNASMSLHDIWCIPKLVWKKGVKCVEFLDSPTTQSPPRNSNQQPKTTTGQEANDVTTHQAAGNALPQDAVNFPKEHQEPTTNTFWFYRDVS